MKLEARASSCGLLSHKSRGEDLLVIGVLASRPKNALPKGSTVDKFRIQYTGDRGIPVSVADDSEEIITGCKGVVSLIL